MSFHRELLLQSANRTDSNAETNSFKIVFNHAFHGVFEVRWITIPNTYYNVNSTNNQIYFEESVAGALTGTLATGSYTSTTLPSAIVTAMEAASALTYTVTYSATLSSLTITPSSGTLAFNYATNTTNSAHKVMGFDVSDTGLAASQTGPNPIQLAAPLSIGINIAEAHSENYVTSDEKQATLIVPYISEFNSFVYQSSDIHRQFLMFKNPVNTLNVTVIDTNSGTQVDLNKGEWEMLFFQLDGQQRDKKRLRVE